MTARSKRSRETSAKRQGTWRKHNAIKRPEPRVQK